MAKQLKLSDLFSASKADNSSAVSPAAQQQNPDTQDKPEADFLKGLPSYNENNFTKCNADSSCKMRKPGVYISTKEHPSEQVITTEKTIILLRYLHQQWNNKNVSKKRDSSKASLDTSESNTSTKVPRLSSTDNTP